MALVKGNSYYILTEEQYNMLWNLAAVLDCEAEFAAGDWFQQNGKYYALASDISYTEASLLGEMGLPSTAYLYLDSTQWAGF